MDAFQTSDPPSWRLNAGLGARCNVQRNRRRAADKPARCSATHGTWKPQSELLRLFRDYAQVPGEPRRVKRQVHVRPVCAARRFMRDAEGHSARNLSATFLSPSSWKFTGIRWKEDA